jgi:mannuronan synthase
MEGATMRRGLAAACSGLTLPNAVGLLAYAAFLLALLGWARDSAMPLLDDHGALIFSLGVIGTWRYVWWFLHLIRARLYQHCVMPRIRKHAEALWKSGWRPPRVHYIIATRNEHADTTCRVVAAIVGEYRLTGIPARLYVVGERSDERMIAGSLSQLARSCDIEVTFIRANQPGKRLALGAALRAVSRAGARDDDPIVFMDGDSFPEAGLLRKCLPLFAMYPRLDALTTDERALVFGPSWMQRLLDMRFSQRHLTMQSHALSNMVITLTGRLSIFRARAALQPDLIRLIEADHLDHWLWGRFRFLSGDDKSTWYALLRQRGGTMLLYVPDTLVWTIERVEDNGIARMKQNLLRWSGNLLRNGSRAIALGPRRVGPFIWWCLIDQRIAIWTSLAGPLLALMAALVLGPEVLLAYLLWVLVTRLVLATVMWVYAGRFDASYPLLIYLSQQITALVKVYAIFRLAQQRWFNRGDQKSAQGKHGLVRFQRGMAIYLTALSATVLVAAIAVQSNLVRLIGLRELAMILGK